jgi:hypothetical protein
VAVGDGSGEVKTVGAPDGATCRVGEVEAIVVRAVARSATPTRAAKNIDLMRLGIPDVSPMNQLEISAISDVR